MTHEEIPVDPPAASDSSQDAVERLLRLSTGHATPEKGRIARLRAATTPHWQRAVAVDRRRRRRRLRSRLVLPLVASVLSIAGLALLLLPGSPLAAWLLDQPPIARVVHANLPAGSPGSDNRLLRAGEILDTGEQQWALELLGEGIAGVSLRLDQGTRVRLLQDGRIELLAGAVYIDNQGRAHNPLVVVTPDFEVVDIGTQFEVRLGQEHDRVRVREGRVEVSLRRSGSLEAGPRVWKMEAGQRLDFAATSLEATISPISRSGSEWSWVVGLAAAPRFDGHPLIDLVSWSARELGLDLVADEPTMDSLESDRVYGDVTGLSPELALEVGLSVSGLEQKIEDGALVLATGPRDSAQ